MGILWVLIEYFGTNLSEISDIFRKFIFGPKNGGLGFIVKPSRHIFLFTPIEYHIPHGILPHKALIWKLQGYPKISLDVPW